jgi:hypothetical protein
METVPIQSIVIENDFDKKDIIINNELSITIHNCPKITRFPDLFGFFCLETISLSHCSIPICRTYFPDSLRTLSITYCSMKEFIPANLTTDVVDINLSFNKLKIIPTILKTIHQDNNHIKINLHNNDLWYLMYSDLSPGMINGSVIDELVFANKLNLVATAKLRYAVSILQSKKLSNEARILANKIGLAIQERAKTLGTTYDNKQNVHLSSVQDNMRIALDKIFNMTLNSYMSFASIVIVLKNERKLNKTTIEFFDKVCEKDLYHSGYNIGYKRLFEQVYAIIINSSFKEDLLKIFIDEVEDTADTATCLTGKMTRLVNVLNGFVLDINVGISKTEELSNSIIVLRNKYAKIYVNEPEKYIAELVPVVWQMLEDNCVPENEHEVWLEYV